MSEGATLLSDLRQYVECLAESGVRELNLPATVLTDLDALTNATNEPGPASTPTADPQQAPPTTPAPETAHAPPSLAQLAEAWSSCQGCGLHATAASTMPGKGNTQSPDIMFVAPAPSPDAAQHDNPFEGESGALLEKMIGAMGYQTSDICVTYVCKCPPPGGRKPTPRELHACLPSFEAEVKLVQPRLIVALGALAVHALAHVPAGASFGEIRGKWLRFGSIPMMPTFAPAELLTTPANKRPAWDDLKATLSKLGRTPPT